MGRFRIDRLTDPPEPLVAGAARVIVPRCHLALRAPARLVGLLASRDLSPEEAIWIPRCASIHTMGMRFPIDAAFLDESGRVLRVARGLRPWRWAGARGARNVVEARAGAFAGVSEGDRLTRGAPRAPRTPRKRRVSEP